MGSAFRLGFLMACETCANKVVRQSTQEQSPDAQQHIQTVFIFLDSPRPAV